jgi:hypothetical protein
MAQIHQPRPVKLIIGLLAARSEWLDMAAALLAESFGPSDLVSPDLQFDFTHYYDKEMGVNLLRRFIAFEQLIDPARLGAIKLATNELEARLGEKLSPPARPVNIDPGYIAPSKLILASAKDFSHRIYLGGGIYAEVTLQFSGGQWKALPFTFPDYASGRYDAFLTAARTKLMEQTKDWSLEAGGWRPET